MVMKYNIQWNSYQTHVVNAFLEHFNSEMMVDVTLCVGDDKIHCHKIMLSACSPYFQNILSCAKSKHTIIVLAGMNTRDVKAIVDFVYNGEMNVSDEYLQSVLSAAETLQISGLMDVKNQLTSREEERTKEDEIIDSGEVRLDQSSVYDQDSTHCSDEEETELIVETEGSTRQGGSSYGTETDIESKYVTKKIHKKKVHSKDYRYSSENDPNSKFDDSLEDALATALEELADGRPLAETASLHSIPRSTLYKKAHSFGVRCIASVTRQEHSSHKIQSALVAISDGCSLQQASELYRIPKTVLWRRLQKDDSAAAKRYRRCYPPHIKEAAIQSLKDGLTISTIAKKLNVSKSTLFREKIRLMEAGKLPWASISRRSLTGPAYEQGQLSQAVAACKEGKMSQSLASSTFRVPKTTIWRRLHSGGGDDYNIPMRKRIKSGEAKLASEENACQEQELVEEKLDVSEMAFVLNADHNMSQAVFILAPNTINAKLKDVGKPLETQEKSVISCAEEDIMGQTESVELK